MEANGTEQLTCSKDRSRWWLIWPRRLSVFFSQLCTHLKMPRKSLWVLCGFFEHQRRVQFEGCVAEPFQTITGVLPGSKWSCLLRIVLQDAMSEVIHSFDGRTKEIKSWRTLWESDEKGSGGEGSKAVNHEKRQGRKEQSRCVMEHFGEKFQECSKRGGVGLATSVETPGVDFRSKSKKFVAMEKARRKAVRCEVSHCSEKLRLSKEFYEDWRGEVVEVGPGKFRSLGRWRQ